MQNFISDLGTFSGAVIAHVFTLLAGCVATVMIAIIEKHFNKKLSWKQDVGVLLLFLFFACFQAWRDEHKNTSTVIADKAAEVGLNNVCDRDLRVESERSKQLQLQVNSQGEIIGNLQNSVNQGSSSINTCVLSLAKNAQPIEQVTTLRVDRVNMNSTTDLMTYIALTNIPVSQVNATFHCPTKFRLIAATGTVGRAVPVFGGVGNVTENDAEFSSSLVWDKNDPIIITTLIAKDADIWGCTLKLK